MTDLSAVDPADQSPIGDNLPPEPIDDVFDELKARTDEITKTGNRWIVERPEITDEDMAGEATKFVKQVNIHKKTVEKVRTDRGAALRATVEIHNARFHALFRPLEIAKERVLMTLAKYLKEKERAAEAERRQAETEALAKIEEAEAAKRAAAKSETETGGDVIGNAVRAEQAEKEAEQAVKAATKAAAPVAVRSDYGQTASVTKRWVHDPDSVDPGTIDLEKLRRYFDSAALDKAIRGFIHFGGRELKGCVIKETSSAVVR